MKNTILLKSKIQFELDYMNIEGFHSDYIYLVEEVDTELYKEVDTRNLTFYADTLDEISQVEDDVIKIILEVEARIEEIEAKEEDSSLDQAMNLHQYYANETI